MSSLRFLALLLVAVFILAMSAGCAFAKPPSPDTKITLPKSISSQKITVVMSAFSDNRNGVFWSFDMSNQLQKKGAKVTVMLFAEAVRLADSRTVQQFEEPIEDLPFWKAFDDFVRLGGCVLVEATTATRLGISQQNLRAGATVADTSTMADAILSSDKVLYFGASLGD